jgi:hypothetical protein
MILARRRLDSAPPGSPQWSSCAPASQNRPLVASDSLAESSDGIRELDSASYLVVAPEAGEARVRLNRLPVVSSQA